MLTAHGVCFMPLAINTKPQAQICFLNTLLPLILILFKHTNSWECALTVHPRYLGSVIPLTVDWTIENKGTWGLMHINGIIITKQFISPWNSKWLLGSVGRVHIHIGYIFLKSNEEIVVRNPKPKIFFYYYIKCVVLFVRDFTIYTYFTLVKVARVHPVASWLPRTTFSDSALMRVNVLFDMPVS